jgi:hypothetical protein
MSGRNSLLRLVGAVVLLSAASRLIGAPLPNAVGVLYGGGVLGSHLSRRSYTGIDYDRDLSQRWQAMLPWGLAGYGEFSFSRWGGCYGVHCEYINDIGLVPVLRAAGREIAGREWYVDFGLGLHVISRTRIGPQVFSTGMQFSEIGGAGLLFGPHQCYDVGLRYRHESNGDWKTPNDGMNFLLLRLALRW